jgi:hypothetical protein
MCTEQNMGNFSFSPPYINSPMFKAQLYFGNAGIEFPISADHSLQLFASCKCIKIGELRKEGINTEQQPK